MSYEIRPTADRVDDQLMTAMIIAELMEDFELKTSVLMALLVKWVFNVEREEYEDDEDIARKWVSWYVLVKGLEVISQSALKELNLERMLSEFEEE